MSPGRRPFLSGLSIFCATLRALAPSPEAWHAHIALGAHLRMNRRFTFAVSVLALSFWGTVAWAQPRDPAAADAAFERGRVAMSKGVFGTACLQFAESYRLEREGSPNASGG